MGKLFSPFLKRYGTWFLPATSLSNVLYFGSPVLGTFARSPKTFSLCAALSLAFWCSIPTHFLSTCLDGSPYWLSRCLGLNWTSIYLGFSPSFALAGVETHQSVKSELMGKAQRIPTGLCFISPILYFYRGFLKVQVHRQRLQFSVSQSFYHQVSLKIFFPYPTSKKRILSTKKYNQGYIFLLIKVYVQLDISINICTLIDVSTIMNIET